MRDYFYPSLISHISLPNPSHQPSLFIGHSFATWEIKWEIREGWGEGLSEGWFFKNSLFMRVSEDLSEGWEIFWKSFLKSNRVFCSSYVYEWFDWCLQAVRIVLSSCSTDANEVFDWVLRGYSLRWNTLFPTWERFIPNMGTTHFQAGNEIIRRF